MSTSVAIIVLVAMLALNAFFVAAEFAMVSARRDQVEPMALAGRSGAKYALRGIEDVSVQLAATQLGITACSLIIGSVGEPAIASLLEGPFISWGVPESLVHPIALVIALLFVTFLHMVLGEMVPKNIAIARPPATAVIIAVPLHVFVVVMRPFIKLMNSTANFLVRKMFKATPKDEVDSTFTSAQVQDFVAESGRQGLLDDDEIHLLQGALSFERLTAADVTLAPDSLVTVSREVTPAQLEALCADTGFSRYPVLSDDIFIGYVHTKDVLSLPPEVRDEPVPSTMIRNPSHVRADEKLQTVMRAMQRDQTHFALVERTAEQAEANDGHSYAGIIAFEDVLEELVGEVREATAR
ncbi:hemolysin family protein [uncultured Corynebacterium sp.]|uniref:hemolysin family protein n=1 Tax=uncultured Corynebacterium sp. TaxID=159447 RepID=UPI0025D2D572|nr:hemolysin family protein [uncultured Corynebacterium sp.]